MKTTIFLLSILLSFSAIAENLKLIENIPPNVKTMNVIIPIFSQKILFSLNAEWTVSSENKGENTFLMEFTPSNESAKNWKNLISIQGFKNISSRITSGQFLDDIAKNFSSVCTNNIIYEKLTTPIIDGHQATTAIIGCAKLGNDNQSEIGYYYSISGKNDIYLLTKSIRGESFKVSNSPLSNKNAQDFINPILPIELCSKEGNRSDCFK
jgi:hypothetical protein